MFHLWGLHTSPACGYMPLISGTTPQVPSGKLRYLVKFAICSGFIIYPLKKMVIFHSYVRLPEGRPSMFAPAPDEAHDPP